MSIHKQAILFKVKEGEDFYFSNVDKNGEHGFKLMSLEDIGKKLREMDIVIPFGKRN